eukprot:scaffold3159_cov393-Prasinococcus_capsulatus_cf.AAC.1
MPVPFDLRSEFVATARGKRAIELRPPVARTPHTRGDQPSVPSQSLSRSSSPRQQSVVSDLVKARAAASRAQQIARHVLGLQRTQEDQQQPDAHPAQRAQASDTNKPTIPIQKVPRSPAHSQRQEGSHPTAPAVAMRRGLKDRSHLAVESVQWLSSEGQLWTYKRPCQASQLGSFTVGGVGRNIAEAVGRLLHSGQPATASKAGHMRSPYQRQLRAKNSKKVVQPLRPVRPAVGQDAAGETCIQYFRQEPRRIGVATEAIKVCQGARTASDGRESHNLELGHKTLLRHCISRLSLSHCLVAVRGSAELVTGVADTEIVEVEVDPKWIYKFKDRIKQANIVVLDANVAPGALSFTAKLANHAQVSVWFEPVSVAKAPRVVPCLPHVDYISPNISELESILATVAPSNAKLGNWKEGSASGGASDKASGVQKQPALDAEAQAAASHAARLVESLARFISFGSVGMHENISETKHHRNQRQRSRLVRGPLTVVTTLG